MERWKVLAPPHDELLERMEGREGLEGTEEWKEEVKGKDGRPWLLPLMR